MLISPSTPPFPCLMSMPCITCHKMVELVCGGSAINSTSLSSFHGICSYFLFCGWMHFYECIHLLHIFINDKEEQEDQLKLQKGFHTYTIVADYIKSLPWIFFLKAHGNEIIHEITRTTETRYCLELYTVNDTLCRVHWEVYFVQSVMYTLHYYLKTVCFFVCKFSNLITRSRPVDFSYSTISQQ